MGCLLPETGPPASSPFTLAATRAMAKVMATNLEFNLLEIIILRQVLREYIDRGGYLAIMVALEALQDLPSPPPAFVAFAQAWQAWQALRCPCGGALPTTFVRPTLMPTILPACPTILLQTCLVGRRGHGSVSHRRDMFHIPCLTRTSRRQRKKHAGHCHWLGRGTKHHLSDPPYQ